MKKSPMTVISFVVACFFILTSFTNVINIQTVASSNHDSIINKIDPKELLFQTIGDITNNKEIQRIIFKSQMSRGIFPNQDIKFPVLTKNQLNQMYFSGLILLKYISKSKIHSMIEHYQVNNQAVQKIISTVIKKNAPLNGEITQLRNSECDCKNKNSTDSWHFPVICTILLPIIAFTAISSFIFEWYLDFSRVAAFFWILFLIVFTIALTINCYYF